MRPAVAAITALLTLIPYPLSVAAQLQSASRAEAPEEAPAPARFAVGGGALLGWVICFNCDEPSAPGASGGFEIRINENWSVVTEGVWTSGYDVYSLEHEGVTYPSVRHDYFAYAEIKMRWEFSSMRHRPYILFGGVLSWDHDTSYSYYRYGPNGNWVPDFDNVRVREELDSSGGLAVGFGQAFKVGDRFEIRPEANLHLARLGLARLGVTGWFKF